MRLLNALTEMIAPLLALIRPVEGTSSERFLQRTLRTCGYRIDNHGGDRVYFTVRHESVESMASVVLEANCIATVAVASDLAIPRVMQSEIEELFDDLNKEQRSYVYQLIPMGEKFGHVVQWRVPLHMIRPENLHDILSGMIVNSRKIDSYASELLAIRRQIESLE